MNSRGSVYRRCGCRDTTTGAQLGAACPRLADPGHGSWYFAIEIPVYPDGCECHRVRRGGYATEEAAAAALAELRRPSLRSGEAATMSTGAWLRTWLDSRTSLAPISREGYEIHIRLYLDPILGRIPLTELRRAHIQEMFEHLAKRGAGGIPLSANTLTRIRATLRAALNVAIREGLLDRNPACGLALPTPRRKRAVIWTEEQVAQWQITGQRPKVAVWTATQTARFLHASRDHRLYAAFHLIALRGLRRAEAAGLRWCDIDLDARILLINHTIQRVGGHLTLCPPKSETSRRMVTLDRTSVKELRRHRERQLIEAEKLGIDPSGFVFTNRRGQPLNPDHLYREFIKAAATAGCPPIRLHDLRHGAGSLALQAGNDLKVIQEKLGHSSIVLTADTYVSVEPELARHEAESTARLVLDAARSGPRSLRHRRRAGISATGASKHKPTMHTAGHSHHRPLLDTGQ
jgi:integrase